MKLITWRWFGLLFGLITVVSLVAACGKSETQYTSTPTPTSTATPPSYTVNINSKTDIGTYLVDSEGMTLYYTTRDTYEQSNITGTTLQNWPVFYVASVTVPSALDASDFATITRGDGRKQTTSYGWPLYYYINDKAPGDTLGQGVAGVWFVVTPDLPPAPTPTPSSPTPTATPP